MANNYGILLLLGAIFTGLVWLVDIFWLKPSRKRNAAEYKLIISSENIDQNELDVILKEPLLVDFSRSFFPIIFIILIIRSFLYEPFQIPSGSMKPTLLVGDFILVEKFSYGLRLSGFNQSYLETGYPEYGDVIVFRYPLDQNDNYIKRIVGLPGDTISYKNKMIEINPACDLSNVVDDEGKCSEKMLIERRLLGHGIFNDDGDKVDMYEEKLGMNWHKILIDPQSTDLPLDNRWTVPEGYYFVMGDNRDKSNDSRYWGFVSENDLVGRAVAIWLHVEFENDWIDWLPSAISFDTTGRIQ